MQDANHPCGPFTKSIEFIAFYGINSDWRRERDSNPRYAFDVNTLSRRAPSTTRPPLRNTAGIWPVGLFNAAGKTGFKSTVNHRSLRSG